MHGGAPWKNNPFEAVNQTSREIMSGDLSRRIPMDHSGDDFDALAVNLNAMLDRIASLMEEVRRISDNIAHDLKTPLSRLKNSLKLLGTGHAEDSQNRRVLIEQSIAEADGLLSTFNALLRIARIDSGERRAAFLAGYALSCAVARQMVPSLSASVNIRLSVPCGSTGAS